MNAQFAVAKDDMSRFPPVADQYFLKGVILSHLIIKLAFESRI